MHLCLIITTDRARSTLLATIDNVNTVYMCMWTCACVYFAANLENCRISSGTYDNFKVCRASISYNNG